MGNKGHATIGFMKYPILAVLYLYKIVISPFFSSVLGHGCRFSPTCSEYSIAVVKQYGVLKGSKLSLKRILKCQPWSGVHVDPIP